MYVHRQGIYFRVPMRISINSSVVILLNGLALVAMEAYMYRHLHGSSHHSYEACLLTPSALAQIISDVQLTAGQDRANGFLISFS